MLVGICTVHYAHNYGAMLQAYALKKYVESKGHKAVMIDKRRKLLTKWSPKSFIKSTFKEKLMYLKYLLKWYIPRYKRIHKREKNFEYFRKKYLDNTTYNLNEQFDLIIYGSDQIWSKFNYGFDKLWWGVEGPSTRNKISYAASMGVLDIDENDYSFILNALMSFSAISVREDDLYQELLNNKELKDKVQRNIDPIFLLTSTEWNKIIKPNQINAPYILFYDFQLDSQTTEIVNQIAKNKGLKILRLTNGIVEINKDKNYKVEAGTLDFISLIYHADFVVSSSFHGVAFSILFCKEFVVRQVWNKERVITLLKSLNIESRFIETYDDYKLLGYIDYESVNNLLKEEINRSYKYLDKYLS